MISLTLSSKHTSKDNLTAFMFVSSRYPLNAKRLYFWIERSLEMSNVSCLALCPTSASFRKLEERRAMVCCVRRRRLSAERQCVTNAPSRHSPCRLMLNLKSWRHRIRSPCFWPSEYIHLRSSPCYRSKETRGICMVSSSQTLRRVGDVCSFLSLASQLWMCAETEFTNRIITTHVFSLLLSAQHLIHLPKHERHHAMFCCTKRLTFRQMCWEARLLRMPLS